MPDLTIGCTGARAEPYAVGPTLLFDLAVSETTGLPIHSVVLRCLLRIEPARRRYSEAESERLADLFGDRSRWGDTLKPIQFANVSQVVQGFRESTTVALSVPCTYDQEVAAGRYFDSLTDGEIPLLMLFSGTVFFGGPSGLQVEPVSWGCEAFYRLPVSVWRQMIDLYFPNEGWLRVRVETLDALEQFKSRLVLPGWDETLLRLLKQAGEPC